MEDDEIFRQCKEFIIKGAHKKLDAYLLAIEIPVDDIKGHHGLDLMYEATKMERLKAIDVLVKHGASLDTMEAKSLIHIAIHGKLLKSLEKLVSIGVDVNYQIAMTRDLKLSPVMAVAWDYGGDRELEMKMMRCLVDHGADVGVSDDKGFSVFTIVRQKENVDELKDYLLAALESQRLNEAIGAGNLGSEQRLYF